MFNFIKMRIYTNKLIPIFKTVKLYCKKYNDKQLIAFPWDATKPQPQSCINWLTGFNYLLEKEIEVPNHFTELTVLSASTRKENTVFQVLLKVPAHGEVIIDFRMEEMMKVILNGKVENGKIIGNFAFGQNGSQVRLITL